MKGNKKVLESIVSQDITRKNSVDRLWDKRINLLPKVPKSIEKFRSSMAPSTLAPTGPMNKLSKNRKRIREILQNSIQNKNNDGRYHIRQNRHVKIRSLLDKYKRE